MIESLFTLPFRIGLRGAVVAVEGAATVAERMLGFAAELAGAVTKDGGPDLDFDGSEHEAPQTEAATATPEAGSETEASQPETDTEPQAETETDTEPQAETETPAEPVLETGTPAAPAPAESEAEALPALDPDAGHVSEEPILVEEVAEPGAEDGAGAEVHVAEPWDGFRQMAADDVIDRISGASAAELAAVELYELSHRNRRTVLAAVEQELARADR